MKTLTNLVLVLPWRRVNSRSTLNSQSTSILFGNAGTGPILLGTTMLCDRYFNFWTSSFRRIFLFERAGLTFFIFFLCDSRELLLFFSSLPIVKNVPKRVQILFFRIARLICLLILSKVAFALGLLFMDELSKALLPFYPSAPVASSGPLPSPPDPGSFHIPAVSQDPEENPPGGSHPPVHQQQDETAGQKKIEAVLEKHLRRHCQLVEVRTKYPQLNSTEVDYHYFAQNMAISQLDTDFKTDREIADLAASVKNYKNIKSLLDSFLDSYYKEDD